MAWKNLVTSPTVENYAYINFFSEFYIVPVDAFMRENGVDHQTRANDFCDLNCINTTGYVFCFYANTSSCFKK